MMNSISLSPPTVRIYDDWDQHAHAAKVLSVSEPPDAPAVTWHTELKDLQSQLNDLKAKEACRDREIVSLRAQVFKAEQENVRLRAQHDLVPPKGAPIEDFMGTALHALHQCHEDALHEIHDILRKLEPKEPEMDDDFVVMDAEEDPAELLKRLQQIIQGLGITDPVAFLEKLCPNDPEEFDFVVVDREGGSVGNGEPEDPTKRWSWWWLFQKGQAIYGGISTVMTIAPAVALFVSNPWVAIGIQILRIRGIPLKMLSLW